MDLLVEEKLIALEVGHSFLRAKAKLAKSIRSFRIDVACRIRCQYKVTPAGHALNGTTLLHHFVEPLNLYFFCPFVGALLSIDAVEDMLFGQDIEDCAHSLEHDRRITIKKRREAPCFEGIVPPDNQVGTLVDLGNCHCATTLNINVVDAQAEVVDDSVLILSLVKLWIDRFGFKKSTKYYRLICLLQLFIVAKLSLSIITPHKQPLFCSDCARMDYSS